LQPAIDGHLEFLREKQGEDQVAKEQNGQGQDNGGGDINLHGLPQLLASPDVEKRQGEENYGEQQHY
jgi:DNA-nicking Smr family endonuclease